MRRQGVLYLRVGAVVVEYVFVLQFSWHHHDGLHQARGQVERWVVTEEHAEC